MDEMRYNLNGSLVETETSPNGKTLFKMVSTDGHRLAFFSKALDDSEDMELGKRNHSSTKRNFGTQKNFV
jgi:DNA polymerase III sliding clamp (beta) subunit (PCNA family)